MHYGEKSITYTGTCLVTSRFISRFRVQARGTGKEKQSKAMQRMMPWFQNAMLTLEKQKLWEEKKRSFLPSSLPPETSHQRQPRGKDDQSPFHEGHPMLDTSRALLHPAVDQLYGLLTSITLPCRRCRLSQPLPLTSYKNCYC